jgi:hypothetical protein
VRFGVRINVGQSLDGSLKSILSRDPPCFRRHVRTLVPAAFAVVSTHQPALGPRGGLWSLLLMDYTNRLMMKQVFDYAHILLAMM